MRLLERVAEYERADKFHEVRSALVDQGISKATINNWFKPKDIAERTDVIAAAYRWRDFPEAIEKLEDLTKQTRNRAYHFALDQLGLQSADQIELPNYGGTYTIYHDLEERIKLNVILIQVEKNPLTATFIFRYRSKNGSRGECDGLIIKRHDKLLFTGFSKAALFHAIVRCSSNHKTDVMLGMAIFECLLSNEVYFSKIAIQYTEANTTPQDMELISKHVARSSYAL